MEETAEKPSIHEITEKQPCITYITALDEGRKGLYVSPQIEVMLGFSPAEWLADPALCLRQLHPEDRERVLEEVYQAQDKGKPFRSEYRLLSREGRVVWVRDEAIVVRNEAGAPVSCRV